VELFKQQGWNHYHRYLDIIIVRFNVTGSCTRVKADCKAGGFFLIVKTVMALVAQLAEASGLRPVS
jgi:hypothetical protein